MLPGKKYSNYTDALFGPFEDSGGSSQLAIDGVTTPTRFKFDSFDNERAIVVINATLTISGGKIDDPANFGGLGAPLTVGLIMGIRHKGGYDIPIIGPLKTNFDIVSGSAESKPWGFTGAAKDVMYVRFLSDYEIAIPAGITDYFYIDIADNVGAITDMRLAFRGHYE